MVRKNPLSLTALFFFNFESTEGLKTITKISSAISILSIVVVIVISLTLLGAGFGVVLNNAGTPSEDVIISSGGTFFEDSGENGHVPEFTNDGYSVSCEGSCERFIVTGDYESMNLSSITRFENTGGEGFEGEEDDADYLGCAIYNATNLLNFGAFDGVTCPMYYPLDSGGNYTICLINQADPPDSGDNANGFVVDYVPATYPYNLNITSWRGRFTPQDCSSGTVENFGAPLSTDTISIKALTIVTSLNEEIIEGESSVDPFLITIILLTVLVTGVAILIYMRKSLGGSQ